MAPAPPRPVAPAAGAVLIALLALAPLANGIAAIPAPAASLDPVFAPPSDSPASLLQGLAAAVPASARPSVVAALEREADAVAATQALAAAPTLEGLLRAAVQQDPDGRFTPAEIPPLPAYASLEEALAALGAAGGRPLSPAQAQRAAAVGDALPFSLRQAIVGLAEHMVVALQLERQALAPVTPDDLAFLQDVIARISHPDAAALRGRMEALRTADPPPAHALLAVLGVDPVRFGQAAAQVDFGAMAAAGAVALRGVDQALPALRALEGMAAPPMLSAGGALAPPPAGTCAGLAAATLVVPGVLLLGFGGPEAYGPGLDTDVLLSIDLGGNDAYCNNAGSTQASGGDPSTGPIPCVPALPIGVAIDVGGDDAYHSTYGGPGGVNTDDTSADSIECFEGAGATGIGVLVDLSGDDGYNSWKVLDDTGSGACPPTPTATGGPGGASLFDDASQGFGGLGVGVLADLGGSDAYGSYNTLCASQGVTTLNNMGTQGAGVAGIGIAADYGAGRNAWGSFNAQWNFGGAGNNHFTLQQQGAGSIGIGVLLSKEAEDHYLSGNTEVATGPISWAVWELSQSQGFGGLGAGLLADPSGNDRYLCGNVQQADDLSDLLAFEHQGVGTQGVGTLVDLDGNDCYDSLNQLTGNLTFFLDRYAQGAGRLAGAGLLVDLGGRQDFLSGNALVGGSGGFAPGPGLVAATTWLDIEHVQGATDTDASLGTLVAANAASGDRYASGNTQASATALDALTLVAAQGSGGGLGAAVFIDADAGAVDSYASDNVANGGAGSGDGAVLFALQGATNFGTGPVSTILGLAGGVSVFADTGGANRYSVGNVYAPFAPPAGCAFAAFPLSAGASCIDWTNGQSGVPLPGVFADLSIPAGGVPLGPDIHFAGPYNSYGLGMYGGFPLGGVLFSICVDALDGIDVPVPVVGGPCLDL